MMEFVSWDDDNPYIMEKNVPKHQPVIIIGLAETNHDHDHHG